MDDLERMDEERALALKAANLDITAAQLILVAATEQAQRQLILVAATEQAQRMADTALAAVDPKSGFLTTMSHEIRWKKSSEIDEEAGAVA